GRPAALPQRRGTRTGAGPRSPAPVAGTAAGKWRPHRYGRGGDGGGGDGRGRGSGRRDAQPRPRGPVDRARGAVRVVTETLVGDEGRRLRYSHAIREALAQEMRRDDSVVTFGEDVGVYGGIWAVLRGLHEEFGDRVFDTPISENLI